MEPRIFFINAVALFMCWSGVIAQQPGFLDIAFNPGSGANEYVFSIALCTNGQILIGGVFTSFNSQPRNYVARLNPDGSLDNGFLPLQGPNSDVLAVAPSTNGGVFIAGSFGAYNGVTRQSLARLRVDGSLDLNWPNIPIDGVVSLVQIQADGKVLLLGGFTHINGVPRRNIARLNPDSTVDVGFNPGSQVSDGAINAFAVQPDENTIIAGTFSTNSPLGRQFIARVSPMGILDPTFSAGYIGGSGIQAIDLQGDGRLVVGGPFTSINGYSRIGVARLNTNGAVDTSFVSPSGMTGNPSFTSVNILSNDKVLLAGSFSLNRNYGIALLNTDGSADSTFNPMANDTVTALCVQQDGKIIVGGYFTSIAGTNLNRIARLNGSNTTSTTLQFLSINPYAGMFLAGIVSNTYRVEWTTNLNTSSLWTPLFDVILKTSPQLIYDTAPMSGSQRFYRAVSLP